MPYYGKDKGKRGSDSTPFGKNLTDLWPDYLKEGYFDAEGNLLETYLREVKVEPLVKAMASTEKAALTTHQVRRFFQHCRFIEAKIRAGSSWEAQRAEFLKLAVAAADAYGKSEKKIPKPFLDFINANTSKVKTKEDFLKGFMPHFEALVGFGSIHFEDKKGR